MGQRCNLIVVEGGVCTVYYDHWAANTLDTALFWGPDQALSFIRQRDPTTEPLLDSVWGEGGAVVNLDTKCLTWFGGEDIEYDIIQKRLHTAMMARNWSGWRLEWCTENVASLADAAGLPREGLLSSNRDEPFEYDSGDYRSNGDTVLTMSAAGHRAATRLSGAVEALASQGPTEINALIADDPVPLVHAPLCAGVHLDLDLKRLGFWTASYALSLPAIRAHWSGWDVTFWGDRFEEHRALMPDLDWPVATKATLKQITDSLRGSLDREGGNLALDAVKRFQDEGREVELNPATFEARDGMRSTLNEHAILDAFEREIEAMAL